MIITRELKEAGRRYYSGEEPTFATVLVAIMIKLYGPEVLEWDGLTYQLEIKELFETEMPRTVYDKMMALVTALATDAVYKNVEIFDETVNALNGHGVGVDQDIPSAAEVGWAVTELRLNDPDPATRSPEQPWGRDIQKYVSVVLRDEGLNIPPKALDFAETKILEAEGTDDPTQYAAAWQSGQSRADEIDQWIEGLVVTLLEQLMGLGINLEAQSAAD